MHTTNLTIENPSAIAPLRLYIQALNRERAEVDDAWVADDTRAYLNARASEHLSLEAGRRYVLAASADATVTVSGSHKIRISELILDDGEWDEKVLQPIAARARAQFELNAKRRIAVLIGSSEDIDSVAYLENRSNTNIQLVREEVGRMRVTPPKPTTWGAPVEAGAIAPGGKKAVLLHGHSRVVIETNSADDITLAFANPNVVHGLRLKILRKDGEHNAALIQPSAYGVVSNGVVAVSESQAAIVEQLPT